MAEEFAITMKKFNEKSIEDKLINLTNVLEKAIRYYNFKIEELAEKIKMVELRFELKQKIIKKKELNKSTSTPPKTEVKSYGVRNAIMTELKEVIEKRK